MAKSIRELAPAALPQIAAQAGEAVDPAVFRSLAADLPVVAAARRGDGELLAYLLQFALPEPVTALHAPPGVRGKFGYGENLACFNFRRIETTLARFVADLASGGIPEGAIAIQGIGVGTAAPGFAEANAIAAAPSGGEYRLWLGTGAEVAIHADPAPNIAYVACGRRRFTLFPPEEIGNLYLGPFDPVPSGTQISLADPLEPDDLRFPNLRGALSRSFQALLEPGDALFIPTGWYHHVEALDPLNLLVNYWWQQPAALPSPWDALMHGFMALRPLSPADRRVWRAMFMHYIFEDNGDPGAHIPPEARGIIGQASPAMIAAMRQSILRSLAGRR